MSKYALPETLIMVGGIKVIDAETWRTRRRGEILELFQEHVFSRAPVGRLKDMTFEVFDNFPNALGGKAMRKQVMVYFTGEGGDPNGAIMDILIYLPKKLNQAVPVFLGVNFSGNHSINPDPAIKIAGKGIYKNKPATEKSRGVSSSRRPIEMIIERGYCLATIYTGDLDPDFDDDFQNGVHAVFDKKIRTRRKTEGRLGHDRRLGMGPEQGNGLLRGG